MYYMYVLRLNKFKHNTVESQLAKFVHYNEVLSLIEVLFCMLYYTGVKNILIRGSLCI